MHELPRVLPEPDVLLALTVEELAGVLLFLMKERFDRNDASHGINIAYAPNELEGSGGQPPPYGNKTREVQFAVAEAFSWLEAQVLVVSALGTNGQNGFRYLSRRAKEFYVNADFERFRRAKMLPRDLLHWSIAEPVWQSFVRGEYDTAAFQAMRQVEIAVREASGADADWPGVKTARFAFKPGEGPLCDQNAEAGEQQGMMDLFAGALGALKNPHSHRVVNLEDPAEAVAVVLFASQLLRIVEKQQDDRAAGQT
jgi:uncharacterized protein (TIGR02391 family)